MTTHIIILYIVCLGFAVLHHLSIRQDRLTVETIKALETRINELEKGE